VIDDRVERLAQLVVEYSLDLREGQVLRISGTDSAEPLIAALHRAAIRRGAHPYAQIQLEGTHELLVAEGSEEQLTYVAPGELEEMEAIDAAVSIWSTRNTRSFTRADPDRHQRFIAARRGVVNRLWERIARGEVSWCGTLFPTHAHAQEAELSLGEYERFVYGACHVLTGQDPVAHWTDVSQELGVRARELDRTRELRIVGPDTDLRVGVEGRRWRAADGHLNMPDGEIFTSPLETETEGEIRYTFPAVFGGREVEDVRLRFEGGRVVSAEAAVGADYLRSLLDMDDGARVLGEVAFGCNYEIDRFTRDTLFDEKIGGTMHLALGSSFKDLGGVNDSGLHWDMVCDLREEGEVYADGELVWRNGAFLREPQPAVEPVA
jgi:aminopeptidase